MLSLWNKVLSCLEERLPTEQIDEWLRPTKILSQTKNEIQIKVPNDIFIDWIQENYLEDIYSVLKSLGLPDCKVNFLNQAEAKQLESLLRKNDSEDQNEEVNGSHDKKEHVRLNPKYKFELFVVGSSNQFAHAASLAVAEAPSASYNPLYLYGPSGLGKTHLLHAIGHRLIETRPDLNICYTTCEEFTNQFINSIRYNKSEAFRGRYRTVDVLLIDDIQFLSGKMQTQEEFFHTFNALFEQQKQIILSSDCAPSEIPKLESRLTSRFNWGLIADIQPPALETRIAILKKKAEAERVFLQDDVVLYLATKVKTNVRELEGALIKLMAYASLSNRKIDLDLVETCLRNYVRDEPTQVSCEKIQRFIADHYKIQTKDLLSKNNSKRIAQPRQIAMYLTRQLTSMSLPEIGSAFGNKHHSTVLYSVQKITKKMKESNEYHQMITGFTKSLT
ncbi:chromosomal replication initiator protein DnaA [Acanthopleuribacter pedis]|uniref:Chromosomal replication initiator protein DnaA n=1 Tax=Acanthopleuribacter pedis TaxID=442870 RepID=A0A8J7Q013_9BACT|nr:chromosomal replication initiator protein DnaA [Acanthopleuribacter pedis]MBO1317887.1 chromosomal replication initiator protein DnaA [Acanthopleuribacter pedis]